LPWDGRQSVKADQAELGAKPEVAVWCLRDRGDAAPEYTVADLPRLVRVLTDVESRVEREGTQRALQENAGRDDRDASNLHTA